MHPKLPLFPMSANTPRRVGFVRPLAALLLLAMLATLWPRAAGAAEQPAATATFSLGALNGPNGFRIDGRAAGSEAGRALRSAGDVNGDGLNDIIIGAAQAAPDGMQRAGEAYVVFGTTTNPTSLNLTSLDGKNGFRLTGALFNDATGTAVAGGDVNGDGLADLLVGAPGAGVGAADGVGVVYVVYGAASFPARLNLGALDGSRGFRIEGSAAGDETGGAVGYAGDQNGDGLGDILIGAPGATVGGKEAAGRAYVIFGRRNFPPRLSLPGLGSAGVAISGVSADSGVGHVVGAAGDMNGDGYDDSLIAAPGASRAGANEAGAVYVLFGQATLPTSLTVSQISGTTGFRAEGAAAGDHAGGAADGGGDVNGDGRDDLLIGAPDAAGYDGRAYVVLGANALPNVVGLGALSGASGVRLLGSEAHGASGAAVGLADVDGDGYDDILVGAAAAGTGSARFAGRVDILFGRPTLAAEINLGALDANSGLSVLGAVAGDQAGQALSGGGDWDGDGFDELLVGAPNRGIGPSGNQGAVFLVMGGPTLGIPNRVTHPGTPADNTLIGTSAADVLHGHRGDDRLDAADGNDALKGGQGDDVLLGGAGGDALIGGAGLDVASYAASPASVTVNLFTGAAGGGHAQGDRLRSIEGLVGSPQADALTGDAGDNRLDGGPGDDSLTGGLGDDRFAFAANSGNDTIAGFVPGAGSVDSLDFTGLPGVGGVGDLTIQADGGNTRITLPAGATIRLLGVAPAALHADDYRFAGAPLAHPDAYSTPVNALLAVAAPGVLANDENPSAVALTAALVAGPSHGTVNLKANGSFTYAPAANFVGEDTFTYRANNGQNSNTAAVTIVVTPRRPTAVNDSYSVALGETLTVAAPGVLANDSNPGNAPLTAVLVEEPLSGTLSLAANGNFIYTSTEEFAGQDSFTYRADNGLASNVATVTIAVFDPNGPPVAVDDSYIALVGQRLTVAAPGVLANDVNPQANGMTAVLAAGPAHGTLALRADGSFTYTPQAGYQGADQFTYRANNGQPSNVATVRITVSRSGFRVFLPVAVSD